MEYIIHILTEYSGWVIGYTILILSFGFPILMQKIYKGGK